MASMNLFRVQSSSMRSAKNAVSRSLAPCVRAVTQSSSSSMFAQASPVMRSAPTMGASRSSSSRRGFSVKVQAASTTGGLKIDLTGKKAFIAGVADDQGFGWAIAKSLAEAGCEITLGVWVPALNIFETSLRRGKFDESRKLSDGSMMEFANIFPMDAVFDTLEDVPEDIATNKRYAGNKEWTVSECAARVGKEVGKIDILVHSLANGPEVTKPLLETSRKGYLAAMSASSYSLVSMVQRFGPLMNEGGSVVSLTYIASNMVIPGYGGGMSSAKAALESDTRVLAYEAGHKYSYANAPIQKELAATEVGNVAGFLLSPLASGVTGHVMYVDNGLNTMGMATDSSSLQRSD
eukprot:gene8981-16117_t